MFCIHLHTNDNSSVIMHFSIFFFTSKLQHRDDEVVKWDMAGDLQISSVVGDTIREPFLFPLQWEEPHHTIKTIMVWLAGCSLDHRKDWCAS